jgi:hypothetical protein
MRRNGYRMRGGRCDLRRAHSDHHSGLTLFGRPLCVSRNLNQVGAKVVVRFGFFVQCKMCGDCGEIGRM